MFTASDIFGLPFEAWVAIATLALAAITGLLTWATFALVRGAEHTAERQLRAYISFESVSYGPLQNSTPVYFNVTLRNVGQTPAHSAVVWSAMALRPYPHDLPLPIDPATKSCGTVGPTQAVVTGGESAGPITMEILRDLYEGRGILFVYGECRYKDVFGRSRTTPFRFTCGGPHPPVVGSMFIDEVGNDAD